MTQQRKVRVAVVFGGRGPEHQVSCMGGGNMLSAIDRSRYEVIPVGITTEGNWVLVADAPERLAVTGGTLPTVAAVAEPGADVVPWSGGEVVATAPAQIPHLFGDVDVVIPVLHGPYGEDGTIQGLLEMAGVRYVGAGVLSSAVSMDKEYMKLIFAARGLPVGPPRRGPGAGLAGRDGRGSVGGNQARARRHRRARMAAIRQAGQGRLEHWHLEGPHDG